MPLKVGGKLIGTLEAINDASTRPFLDHDMHLLQALADYAAIAIENSRLFRELEESKEREKQIIRNVFERYVTPAVVEQLLSSPQSVALGGARQPIAVMFADVRGFTSLAEPPAGSSFHIPKLRSKTISLPLAEMDGQSTRPEGKRVTAAAVPPPGLAVPASLQASLMSRLDRLGPAKEVAQIGAAIGREFSHALLAAVAQKPDTQLIKMNLYD